MPGVNGHAKVLRDNRRMPEVFRDLPGYVNELTDDVVRLAQAGRVEEVRALIARLLSQTDADDEPCSPGEPALILRGIVGEIRVAASTDQTPVQITMSCPEHETAPDDFAALVATINNSIRQNKNFLDANGKPTPAHELKVEDLVKEVGRIILTRMNGWVRVERPSSVSLD